MEKLVTLENEKNIYYKCPIAEQEQISKSQTFFTLAEEIHNRKIQ